MLLERIKEIREELTVFPDAFSQYAFLVELSALLPEADDALMSEANRFSGCQSQVWLELREEMGVFTLRAASDTLIMRGMLYILQQMLNGCSVEEIAAWDGNVLAECGIEAHFSGARSAGIRGVIQKIRDFCRTSLKTG